MTAPASLSYDTYKDKVLAGWIGKSFGGVIGAPLECHKELKNLALESLWPEKMLPNDDLDLQVLWLEASWPQSFWRSAPQPIQYFWSS